MTTCLRCHSAIAADARFCKECGARIDTSSPADAPTLPTASEGSALPAGAVTQVLEPVDESRAEAVPQSDELDRTLVADSRSQDQTAPIAASPSEPTRSMPFAPRQSPRQIRNTSDGQSFLGRRFQWIFVLIFLGALGIVMIFACIGLAYLIFNSGGNVIFAGPTATTAPQATRTPRPTTVAQVGVASTPTPSGNVLLRDDFSRTDDADLVGEDDEARYAFEDGAYAITAKVDQIGVWRKFSEIYDNLTAQVDTTLVDGPQDAAAGVIFRYQDSKNFYIFNVAGNGQYNLEVRKNDSMTTLIDWTPSPAIKHKGEMNALRVEAVDNAITLYVNGVKLEETKDSTFAKGQIAIAVNTFDQGDAKVLFDNLLVEGK